jgi:hypothetical protein
MCLPTFYVGINCPQTHAHTHTAPPLSGPTFNCLFYSSAKLSRRIKVEVTPRGVMLLTLGPYQAPRTSLYIPNVTSALL